MFYLFYQLSNGLISQKGHSVTYPIPLPSFGIIKLTSEEFNTTDFSMSYIENSTIVSKPLKPEGFYEWNSDTKQWEIDLDAAKKDVLAKRDALLYASDWTQIPNGPLTEQQMQEWAVYRQELRDITNQAGYPTNVVFPVAPTV